MVNRIGVGATSASALVFSVILVCNFAIYAASQDRAVLHAQADAEDLLNAEGTVLEGATVTNILLGAQSVLGSGPIYCSIAQGFVSTRLASLHDAQRTGPLSVSTSSVEVSGVDAADNLSMVFPFNGSAAGFLTLAVTSHTKTVESVAGVSLDRSVTHLVHLPVRWNAQVRDCIAAVAAISRSVSSSRASSCTSAVVPPLMANASSGPDSTARADGFDFALTYEILTDGRCAVSFTVTLGQTKIEGPGGGFSVLLEGGGVASFA
jgi:hypothetical protein